MSAPNPLDMVAEVAVALGDLREHVVFVGGAVLGLLFADPAAPLPRPTTDVDLIADVPSLVAYQTTLSQQLRTRGFREDISEGAPLCRWVMNQIKVDVIPRQPIWGQNVRWVGEALVNPDLFALAPDVVIRLVKPANFLALKLEAFADRGNGDFAASRDIEDVVAVVDGRASIADDVRHAADAVRDFLRQRISELLADRRFGEALPGHLPGDDAGQARIVVVLRRLQTLAAG